MRPRRLLLASVALSSSLACKKEKPPAGNPKETGYDARLPIVNELPGNPKGVTYDAALAGDPPPPPPVVDAGVDAIVHRMPANPKGSHYDAGPNAVKPKP
jgi:hypothetical protein